MRFTPGKKYRIRIKADRSTSRSEVWEYIGIVRDDVERFHGFKNDAKGTVASLPESWIIEAEEL